MTFVLAFFLSALIHEMWQRYVAEWIKTRKAKKNREKDDRPTWERLADAYEKAAEQLLDYAVNTAESGYRDLSRRSLEEADYFMAEAKRIKQQALEDMMEGKIL